MELDVEVPKQAYNQLKADVSAGSMTVENLSAKTFTLHSSAGAVHATNLNGDLQATSSAGSVTVSDISGNVALQSSAGTVTARAISGSIQAHSSAGSVRIYLEHIQHDITADSSAGSVLLTTVNEPKDLKFRLHASTGSVNFGLPNAQITRKDRSNIQGFIGQGGPMLNLQSSAGSVEVTQGSLS